MASLIIPSAIENPNHASFPILSVCDLKQYSLVLFLKELEVGGARLKGEALDPGFSVLLQPLGGIKSLS